MARAPQLSALFHPLELVLQGVVVPHLEFTVAGTPGPQGSKTKFAHGHMTESSKAVKPWREAVVSRVQDVIGFDHESGALPPGWPLEGPTVATMVFTMPKPQAKIALERRTGRRQYPAQNGRNDVSKLARSTEDALVTAGAIRDDGMIVDYRRLAKVFPSEDPDALDVLGARIRVWCLDRIEVFPDPAAVPDVIPEHRRLPLISV